MAAVMSSTMTGDDDDDGAAGVVRPTGAEPGQAHPVSEDDRVLRVILAEELPLIRGAIVALLQLEDDIKVVADVGSGHEVLPICHLYRPDVAIIDIALPVTDGITVAAALHREIPETRVLVLSSQRRPGFLRKALAVKVSGFVTEDVEPGELANAVRIVAAGRRYVAGDFAIATWETWECPLSTREIEVLRSAAAGAAVEEIGLTLFLSIGTVRNYLSSAVAKLNARNRIDAIRIADSAGWL
ncbi:MAG: two component transcriptional regulator, LuxR family [Glaciihabitans sp.]|nr:two component transcriptional regulator, LuxR family [Glaciihabitans sp.]